MRLIYILNVPGLSLGRDTTFFLLMVFMIFLGYWTQFRGK
jgi:hypothetical protein